MLSIELIRKNPKKIKEMLARRKSALNLDKFLKIDENARQLQTKLEAIKAERNQFSRLKDLSSIEKGKALKLEIAELEKEFEAVQKEKNDFLHFLPNLLADDVPDGVSDKDNVELKRVGKIRKFDFEVKWHSEIGETLGILDVKAGVKVSGSGFTFWRGDGARLLHAMFCFALDFLQKRGFEFMFTPIFAHAETFFGTGYLPFGSDQLYKVDGEDLAAIGTSEQTLLSFFSKSVVDLSKEPLLLTAYTPCFRTEKGSYGKETKGVFRMHQFYKVEQIVICKPEESEKWHNFCLENEEELFRQLNIPYRVVNVCTGDLGAPASKKFDIEGWFPAYEGYRELTSNSNLLDFQSRRLGIKFRREDGSTEIPHTISATGITERALLAILENNQTKDGSVIIPEVLVPYMGGQRIIARK